MFLPSSVEPTFLKLSHAFTQPTAGRMRVLIVGMILSLGRHTVYKWGHQWVVLAIVVKFPWARCPWSLPIMATLYRTEKLDTAEGRRHKTPSELARQMLAALIHWFPRRNFILTGDGGYATVDWYGGGTRRVRILSETGLWYNRGRAVPIRWVYVVDLEGTHRDDCLFSTDVGRSPTRIVSLFTRRWSIGVTFEEVRAHLGFETTRQRVAKSVLRMAPCLLGLFSTVSLIFHTHQRRYRVRPPDAAWYIKENIPFSDAIATVRRLLWAKTIFGTSGHTNHIARLPRSLRVLLLDSLSRAA